MDITMDPAPTHQVPSGPMTRARARAIKNEVTSLLLEFAFQLNDTWVLLRFMH
jgi:hypothetical protein